MPEQLFFDLDFQPPPKTAGRRKARRVTRALQRATLRWLEHGDAPAGVGVDVVTRVSRLKADVAAFWSRPVRNEHGEGPRQILVPGKTVVVQCHAERDECWPDCIRSAQILPQLRDLKAELAEAEARIRQSEPELRATNTLFDEYAEWRYEASADPAYHRVKRGIEKMEHGLYHGTKFERIRSAQLADFLYLAVPKGVVDKAELADGWGLLWVTDDLSVEVVSEAEDRACLPSNRMHLVQNIAAACKASSLLYNGIRRRPAGPAFVRPPRRHRGVQTPRLSNDGTD